MTMAMRGAVSLQQHRVLLVQNEAIALTHNCEYDGLAVPAIVRMLYDETITQSYVTGTHLYETLAYLNSVMSKVPAWRMRFTNRRRYAITKDKKKIVTGRFFVDYFCLDRKLTNTKRLPRKRIDVINLDLLREKPPEDAHEQLEMALAILEMCENRGIRFRGTRGGLGNAMLKASPFWEKGRYAAPKFINDDARSYLPGNFYSLSYQVEKKDVRRFKHCYYVDQTSSHHNIVRTIPLPHPQYVRARGHWHRQTGVWCKPDSQAGKTVLSGLHVGLLLAKVQIGTIPASQEHLYPPWMRKRGDHKVWIWTPELSLLEDQRVQLEYLIAGYTSTVYDPVLPEYAQYALAEIAGNSDRARYKKGSLLAAYGMLAFNSAGRNIYRYWGGNTTKNRCEIPVAGIVGESRIKIPADVQLSTVNVIARGVIEATTRTRSIELARYLHNRGYHVPQIYADGVLVETEELPFLPDGWRISHSLTNVYIPRSNAIMSDQIVKLPGVAEQDREYMERREEAFLPLTTERIEVTETPNLASI